MYLGIPCIGTQSTETNTNVQADEQNGHDMYTAAERSRPQLYQIPPIERIGDRSKVNENKLSIST